MENRLISKMTISEAYPHLELIAKNYSLKLNRVNDFKIARLLLVNLYNMVF